MTPRSKPLKPHTSSMGVVSLKTGHAYLDISINHAVFRYDGTDSIGECGVAVLGGLEKGICYATMGFA
jgi:hypothetical protein